MNQIVLYDAQQQHWLRFSQPQQIIETNNLESVLTSFRLVNKLAKEKKLYAAGFISYEATPAFDPALYAHQTTNFPLLWFGLFTEPEIIVLPEPKNDQAFALEWSPTVTKAEYNQAIAQIKQHIRQGNTYQVNYTMRLQAEFNADPWQYFLKLVQGQQANYSAYLDLEDFVICSASPELFFRWQDQQITTRPMKGTVARGYSVESDRLSAQWLQASAKNRAENVMIVDMIRNDLAKVAQPNTVKVPSLFEVEQYPTLWQMTSTVTARSKANLPEIMTALFPCASITGAPKASTTKIIKQLEPTPRKIYTGTIGMINPHNFAQFNVAIRTVLIDKKTKQAEYGVGGGIVWDSASASEYEECQVKARVLLNQHQDFKLLETLLWTPQEGYFLLDRHLHRLKQSAQYFKFSLELAVVEKQLLAKANSLEDYPYKVRLLISRKGQIVIEAIPLKQRQSEQQNNNQVINNQPIKLGIATEPIKIENPFLYHKTTNREVYRLARQLQPNCDDVLLWNDRQEITESCIANIVCKIDNQLLTPPIECGLLAGTFRNYLLDQGKIKEAKLKLSELKECESIYLINSVRKWQNAIIIQPKLN